MESDIRVEKGRSRSVGLPAQEMCPCARDDTAPAFVKVSAAESTTAPPSPDVAAPRDPDGPREEHATVEAFVRALDALPPGAVLTVGGGGARLHRIRFELAEVPSVAGDSAEAPACVQSSAPGHTVRIPPSERPDEPVSDGDRGARSSADWAILLSEEACLTAASSSSDAAAATIPPLPPYNVVALAGGRTPAHRLADALRPLARLRPHMAVTVEGWPVLLPFPAVTVSVRSSRFRLETTSANPLTCPEVAVALGAAAEAARRGASSRCVLDTIVDGLTAAAARSSDPASGARLVSVRVVVYHVGTCVLTERQLRARFPAMDDSVRDVIFEPSRRDPSPVPGPDVVVHATRVDPVVLDAAYGVASARLTAARALARPALRCATGDRPTATTDDDHHRPADAGNQKQLEGR